MPKKSIIGRRFGKLVVLDSYRDSHKSYIYTCRCDCGRVVAKRASALNRLRKTRPEIISCGCTTLLNAKRHNNGYFVSQKSGERKLGPALLKIMSTTGFYNSEYANEVAQFHRAITFRLKSKKVFYNPNSLLGKAYLLLRGKTKTEIREKVNKLGYIKYYQELTAK